MEKCEPRWSAADSLLENPHNSSETWQICSFPSKWGAQCLNTRTSPLMWVFHGRKLWADIISVGSGGLSCCRRHFTSVFWVFMNNRLEKGKRYSPILRKLSDKVLLNFFILPIFSGGWEAGIRSHIIIFFNLSPTDFGSGLAVGLQAEKEEEEEDRCSGSPAGLLQPSCNALANTGNGAWTALTALIN